ncbi:MAG TPA: DHHA1 domain-containing protein, partial [Candidatus Acidoferrales bacterium]|nr:DHHA1 domain-containing protein [Candidatus Acidoferrales bacterium]
VVPGRELRIIKIGDWDVEACGGTHCTRTGQLGALKILRTERIQDGVERIIFAAGTQALRAFEDQEEKLKDISLTLEAPIEKLDQYVQNLVEEKTRLEKRLEVISGEWAGKESQRLLASATTIGPVKLFAAKYTAAEENDLVQLNSRIIENDPTAVTVLLQVKGSARVFVGAGKKAMEHGVHAGNLARKLAAIVGGGGGGRDYFGQGGGTKLTQADEVLVRSPELVKEMVTK